MAFLSRISQSKLRHLTQQSKSIPYASLLNPTAKSCVSENPYLISHCGNTGFANKVRFFAAPVQANANTKKIEKGPSGPRMNERIQADVIRLVMEEGHCIISRSEALQRAKNLDLDLVEVQGSSNPPVCKIMDYHKEKYKKVVRDKELIKNKSDKSLRADIKEVKFSRKTEAKDLKMKADMVKRLMEKGYRVKCTAVDASTSADAEDEDFGPLFSPFVALMEDVALTECEPTKGKVKEAYLIVRHMKYGPSKKGAGKKAKTGEKTGTEVQTKSSDDINGVTSQVAHIPGNTVPQRASSRSDISESHILNAIPQRAHTVPLSPRESSDGIQNRYRKNDQRNPSPPTRGMDNRGPVTREPYLPYQSNDQGNPSPPTRGMDNRGPGMTEPYIPFQSNDQRNPSPPTRGIDNRGPGMRQPYTPYQSNDQRDPSPALRGMDNRGPGMREPHIPVQRRGTPTDVNFSPPPRDPRQAQTNAPVFRNPVLPPNDIPKQESASPSAPRTGLGFGIFSNPTSTPPARQGIPDRVPANANSPPSSRPDGSQRPGIGTVGQKGFGIFGRDGSH